MPQENKNFSSPDAYLDADTNPFAAEPTPYPPNAYVNAENVRTGFTQSKESIGSNVLISQPQPSVTFLTIGSVEDTEDDLMIKFNLNTTGTEDKIIALDINTDIEYVVLLSSQVIGGLNFSKDHPIHSAKIINGLLVWPDDFNEPKSIILKAAINLNNPGKYSGFTYTAPLKYESSTLIKRPPVFPCIIQKVTDNTYLNNFIVLGAYQFLVRYQYRNYQYSAMGSFSHIAPLNFAAETFNRIDVTISGLEYIDDDIFQIDLCVRFGNYGKTGIIKSWNKDADATAIANHNNGSSLLAYAFFDDQTPILLDDVTANTPFHDVPLISEGLEVARNRNYLTNNLLGYDTPITTSLAVTLGTINTGGAGTFVATWKYMTMPYIPLAGGPTAGTVVYYYLYYSAGSPSTSYFYDSLKLSASPPPTVNAIDATSQYNTELNLFGWVQRNYSPPAGNRWGGGAPTFTNTGTPISLVIAANLGGLQFFKSNSTIKVSIEFKDRFTRKTGLVYPYQSVSIPLRTYNQSVFNAIINWTLSNNNALAEIPDWAYYYQICISKNETTRFFVQINASGSAYITRNPTTLVYTYVQNTYATPGANQVYATAFDLTPLFSNGLGYSFNEGDELILYKTDGTSVTLPVITTDGSYIFVKPTDIGDLTTNPFNVIEIYTPYKPSVSEPLYETGAVYSIIAPGTSGRLYGTLSDQINGDCYAIERDKGGSSLYYTEAMSPNDKLWQVWQTDTGWVNFVDTIGQQRKETNIVFSDPFILGSKTNGSNVFQPLNAKDLDAETGTLRKVILTSKAEAQGNVLLTISENETCSIYLGEVQIVGSDSNAYVASSANVIGTVNVLKGNYGTINPEAVIEYRGLVFFPDANSKKWIQYSENGLDPINYKMERFWELWFTKFLSMSASEIEAFGGRPFLFTAVDTYYKELIISIPKLSNDPPKGYLPDYPDKIYPFDILDFRSKTMIYRLGSENRPPHWEGAYTFYAENFITIQNRLYSFKNGLTFQQNDTDSSNNFFGIQYTSKIMPVSSLAPKIPKVYNNLAIGANLKPSFIYMYNDYPVQQSSDLMPDDDVWEDQEGVFKATIYRNKLQPTVDGFTTDGLLTGQKMRNQAMFIMLEFDVSSEFLELNFLNIGFQVSKGHENLFQK